MAETIHLNVEQAAAMNPKEICRDCRALKPTWVECRNCYKPICAECTVTCAACPDFDRDGYCVNCALNHAGFEKRDGKYYCENDALPDSVLDAKECL